MEFKETQNLRSPLKILIYKEKNKVSNVLLADTRKMYVHDTL